MIFRIVSILLLLSGCSYHPALDPINRASIFIEQNTNYRLSEIGEPLPSLVFTTREEIVRRAGIDRGHGHNYQPFALFDGTTIYIWQGVTSAPNRQAILVHELTHWFQMHNNIVCSGEKEWEAYTIHAAYLKQYNIIHDWDWGRLEADLLSC